MLKHLSLKKQGVNTMALLVLSMCDHCGMYTGLFAPAFLAWTQNIEWDKSTLTDRLEQKEIPRAKRSTETTAGANI